MESKYTVTVKFTVVQDIQTSVDIIEPNEIIAAICDELTSFDCVTAFEIVPSIERK